jgi:uncharacterized protein with PIN domain
MENTEKCIETKVLKESALAEHFEEFDQEYLERCPDCGSSLFRIYKEPVKEGLYEQFVCAICNHRYGGWLNDFKIEGKEHTDGRICRKCGNELER